MLLDSAELRPSRVHGNGVFATRSIPAGTVVWAPCPKCPRWEPKRLRLLPSKQLHWLNEFGYCLIDSSIILPCSPAYMMNHSCESNVLAFGIDFAIATRLIRADEEITFDYRLFMCDPDFAVQCRCGTRRCSKVVSPRQGRDDSLQRIWTTRQLPAIQQLSKVHQPLAPRLHATSSCFRHWSSTERSGLLMRSSICSPGCFFQAGPQ